MNAITPAFRVERIGNATLYLGDCRDVLPHLTGIDAVVSDPPYGISLKWDGVRKNGRKSGLKWGSRSADRQPEWKDIVGDDRPFDPSPLLHFPQLILWGGNNYQLPPARCWLVWDKRRDMTPDNHGDAELAWTNLDGVIRIHRQIWRGIVREGEENVANGAKYHPTQKPYELMRWCVEMTTGTVLDPYMGSGSTGVACARLGRPFVGVEIEPRYFNTAYKRIEEAQRQPLDMFAAQTKEDPSLMRTGSLFEGMEG